MEGGGEGGGIFRACLNVGVDCMKRISKGWRLLQTMGVDCMEL